MKRSEKTVRRWEVGPPVGERERSRLEFQVLLLQSAIATFFVGGVMAGFLGSPGPVTEAAIYSIAIYHVFHAWYVVRYRMAGHAHSLVEALTPLCDVACITMAWVALGDSSSPLWAVYLYAIAGYARRIEGVRYKAIVLFVVANLVGGYAVIEGHASALVSANAVTMALLALAMAALSNAVTSGWRKAERRARMLAEIDPLTGIANRRRFLEMLDLMARDHSQTFAVLMLDLDDFKRLNDHFGHIHGDAVLEHVARVLSENVREGDFVARYGGEEFVIAMPGTNLPEAGAIAERLREAILSSTPTTVSIGAAASEPGEPSAIVLYRADEMLLYAKRTGKNVVRMSPLKKSA
ncbi:MAG TPA: GGDEF domain-containing protein [Tepidiformaceae bacterium]|nr:GGDEF domain-containing protein [Tepidiformaceae bacterium]